jgi:hypothetical protein
MAYTGTLCTEAEIVFKEGANVSASVTEAHHNMAVAQAESFLVCVTRYNWIDNYASLNEDVKRMLSEAVSNLAAVYSIQYDMSGYSSRVEAEDMMNILWARFLQITQLLTDQNTADYIKGA